MYSVYVRLITKVSFFYHNLSMQVCFFINCWIIDVHTDVRFYEY